MVLLPGCPCCGSTPCEWCPSGESLPDTVTLDLSVPAGYSQGADLIEVGVSACFGAGAAIRVTSPGGAPGVDDGPISAASVTAGGSGYAVLGREEPDLSISATVGSGATFSPSFTEDADACGRPIWTISGITASPAGSGYADYQPVTITPNAGTTQTAAPDAYIRTGLIAPTVTATATGGSGAVLSVSLTSFSWYGETRWKVTGVSVTSGGSGYTQDDPVTFDVTGTGWADEWASATINVDGGGAITSVTISYEGAFADTDGSVASVVVSTGGWFYKENAALPAIVADVTLTVTQTQPWYAPTAAGASLSVTVDDDPGSGTFGHITGVTIDAGGDNYLAWRSVPNCWHQFDGRSFVLARSTENPCVYEYGCSPDAENAIELLYFQFRPRSALSPNKPVLFASMWQPKPTVEGNPAWLGPGGRSGAVAGSTYVEHCDFSEIVCDDPDEASSMPFPAGTVATVTPGGEAVAAICRAADPDVYHNIKLTLHVEGSDIEYTFGSPLADNDGTRGIDRGMWGSDNTWDGASSALLTLGLTWDGCRSRWYILTLIYYTPSGGVWSSYFASGAPLPEDADGYPADGVVTLFAGAGSGPRPDTITCTISRVLP